MNCPIMQQTILDYVNAMLKRLGNQQAVTVTDSLVISGRLQSVDIVELAAWLEKEFHLDFVTYGFNQYDFDSVNAMMDMIEAHKRV